MCRQCPEAFEFSEELLLFLSEHATSGWFGDFLLDCEQDRYTHTHTLAHPTLSRPTGPLKLTCVFVSICVVCRVSLGVRERSVSIWEAVQGQRQRYTTHT